MVKAALLSTFNEPTEVVDLEIESPHAGEVRVQIAASGVCHSDLSVKNGTIPLPTPIVLGHEGAGVVTEVGEGVTSVEVGDHVVLSFVPACGECRNCTRGQPYLCEQSAMQAAGGLLDGTTRFSLDGNPIHQMACCGTYAAETIVPAISMVKIDDDIPLELAALIGCGVLTGVGAALNTADIRAGDSVAVIGCGGVGLNVIQGAKIAGASQIIAVDLFDSKLEMAKQFGATDVVHAGEGDPVAAVMELTEGRGADVSFEVIGIEPTIMQAINSTRSGGEVILVGVPALDTQLDINAAFTFLYTAKTIKGCWYGSSDIHRDVPKLLELWKSGDLKLEELISREIGIEDVDAAFEAMGSGEVARSVIKH